MQDDLVWKAENCKEIENGGEKDNDRDKESGIGR